MYRKNGPITSLALSKWLPWGGKNELNPLPNYSKSLGEKHTTHVRGPVTEPLSPFLLPAA